VLEDPRNNAPLELHDNSETTAMQLVGKIRSLHFKNDRDILGTFA
jgi:hypothetical protein